MKPWVLVGAYACAPPGSATMHGGEELLGWRVLEQLGQLCRVDALVSAEHRDSIEGEGGLPGVTVHYVDLPPTLTPLRTVPGGVQLYAYLWQIKAWRLAERLTRARDYDLYHHLTYANDWMASHAGAFLDLPYIRGPGGGAHRVPRALLSDFRLRHRVAQHLRTTLQKLFRLDPVFRRGRARARSLLVCTRASAEVVPPEQRAKVGWMPVVGVTEKELSVETSDGRDGEFTVISAGKLLPHKGFGLAIRSFAQFRRQADSGRLLLAGTGPERERLEQLAEWTGVGGQIEFLGWVPHDELLERMAAADVTLFPSLRDGGGAVVVESMAAATPVVCLDVAGPGIHVTDETGAAVEPAGVEETIDRLAAAVRRLWADPEWRQEAGAAARRRAREHYRWSHRGDELLRLYRQVLQDGATS